MTFFNNKRDEKTIRLDFKKQTLTTPISRRTLKALQ